MATYATLAELKTYLRISDTTDDALLQLALDAATEAIDVALGTPGAGLTSAVAIASVAVSNPGRVTTSAPHWLSTGQSVTIAGTTTTPTINGVRVATVLTDTSFTVPIDVTIGQLAPAGTSVAAVPASIKLATYIQATRWYKRQDAPYGVLGGAEFGNYARLLATLDPDVALLLNGHGDRTAWGTTV